MGKFYAKQAFNQLADAYLTVCKNSKEARVFVNDLLRDHNHALDEYYFTKDGQKNSRKALKNDVKGLAGKWKS